MKKGWKIFWIACLCVVGIGVVLCCVGVGLGATLESLEAVDIHGNSENMDESASAEYNNVSRLELDVSAGEVHIMLYDGDVIRTEQEGINSYECRQDGRSLIIRAKKKRFPFYLMGHNVGVLNIYLPREMKFDEADIDIGAGQVQIAYLNADSMDIDVGAGELLADYLVTRDLDIDVGAGSAEVCMPGRREDYHCVLSYGIGEIVLDGESSGGLGGKSTLSGTTGRQIEIDVGVGSAVLDFDGGADTF